MEVLKNKMSKININFLSKFLVKAKKATFAGGGSTKIESSRPKSIDYFFKEGALSYRDSYFGSNYDIVEEIVWNKDEPIWGMNYMGGMKKDSFHLSNKTFIFLKKCLSRLDESMPFRGPKYHKEGDFEYKNKFRGNVIRFSGSEKIFFKGEEIYEGIYHGGLIK